MKLTPTIIDRYLIREFLLSFIAVMGFCTVLLLVASIFDKFQDILEHNAPFKIVALYFLSTLPGKLMYVIPLAATMAVLFSVGALARTNEILAMLTSGVHGLRIALPISACGIVIVILTFVMNEYIVPPLEAKARRLELLLEGRSVSKGAVTQNVFMRGGDGWFYLPRTYNEGKQVMGRPIVIHLNPTRTSILERIEGLSAKCVSNDKEAHQSIWLFDSPKIWKFGPDGHLTTYTASNTSERIALEEDLAKILAQKSKPEEMNYHQLGERIEILEARDQPVFSLRTDLLRKITFPLGILVIMMIGFSFAVRARAGTVMKFFGAGITWALIYYIVYAVSQALGHSGTLSPIAATVVPTLAFAAVAFVQMRRSYLWHS